MIIIICTLVSGASRKGSIGLDSGMWKSECPPLPPPGSPVAVLEIELPYETIHFLLVVKTVTKICTRNLQRSHILK